MSSCRLTNEQRDLAAENLGLAGRQAKKVWNRGHQRSEIKDLQQAAMIGLCNATRTYDPSKGVKFATYASAACYHAALNEAIMNGVIRLPHWHTKKKVSDTPNRLAYREVAAATRFPVQFQVKRHDYWHGPPTGIQFDNKDELVAAMATLLPLERYIVQVHCNGATMEFIGHRIGLDRFQVAQRIKNIITRIRKRFG